MKKWRIVFEHFIVWVLFIALALIFGASYLGLAYIIPKLIGFIGLAVTLFYFNYSYLIPKFYLKKLYFRYLIFSLMLILSMSTLRYYIEKQLIPINAFDDIEQNELLIFLRYLISCIVVFVYSLLFRIIADWRKQEREIYEWKALKNETDLKFLKNQLRPHFLFNSINNIYSVAVEHNDRTAPLLLEISQMLRYLIYKSDQELISLSEEVHFLNSLIKLYGLRYDEIPFEEIELEGNLQHHEIPPFIFLSFIENIFKHGDFEQLNEEWFLRLRIIDETLRFESQNPIRPHNEDKEPKSGIGLSNVKQRLELLFPNAHKLTTKTVQNNYYALLELKLNEN